MSLESSSIGYRCAVPADSQSSIDKGELRHFFRPDSECLHSSCSDPAGSAVQLGEKQLKQSFCDFKRKV